MINNKIYNLIICNVKSIYYRVFEYFYLRYARTKYSNKYHNNTNPLVSIIIATYNRSQILYNRTIPAALNQTHKNIEVIIVGDKCIDNTPELINSISDNRVRFYDLPKRGKYPIGIKDRWFVQGTAPRNKGMQIANGDWFVFISDDDIMCPNHIEILLKNAKEKDLEFISAAYESIKGGKKIIVDMDVLIGGMPTWLYRSYLRCFKWNIDAWRKSWNRPVDYDLKFRFMNAGVKFGHINEIVAINPAVEGTNTTGYEAAILAEKTKFNV